MDEIKNIKREEGNNNLRGIYCGTAVSIKGIANISIDTIKSDEFKKELYTLSLLHHPNIAAFVGAGITPKGAFCIVTELCAVPLTDLLQNSSVTLTWKKKHRICLDIAQGMNYLHSYKPPLLHRNITSAAIYFVETINAETDPMKIMIKDFGFTSYENEIKKDNYWIAPEILMAKEYTSKSEVYSFGIIIWEIVTRKKINEVMNGNNNIDDKIKLYQRLDEKLVPVDCPKIVFFYSNLNR